MVGKRKKEESGWNKCETLVNIVDTEKILSINNSHVGSLNVPINRQDIQSVLTKYSFICQVWQTSFKYDESDKLNVKDGERYAMLTLM